MGLFDRIFKPRQEKAADTAMAQYRTLSAYSPVFTSRLGSVYEMLLTRAAVHAFATHASKLKPEVTGSARPDLKTALGISANPFQNTAQMLYRTATILENDTSVFIVPVMDETGRKVVGFFPIVPATANMVDYQDQPWLRFTFPNGQATAVEANRVGLLTKYQYKDDFFGGGNTPLTGTLDVLDVQEQAMQEAIKQSATIRFMARLGQTLRPEDIVKERDRFAKDNLSADNKSGVMMFDAKYADIQQIESNPWLVDAEQMKIIKDNVFSYFGCNEAILQGSYDEEGWNAYYEGKIEPFALQLSLELTRMTFTPLEITRKNSVMFSSNRLQYAANSTKVSVVQQLVDRGIMALEDAADVFNLPTPDPEDGKTRVIRGEYIPMENLPTHTIDKAQKYLRPPAAPESALLAPLVADAQDAIRRRGEADAKRGRARDVTVAFAMEKVAPLAEAHRIAGLDFDPQSFIAEALGRQPGGTP